MNADYRFDDLFIGGAWVVPDHDKRLEVRSPATDEVIGYAPDASEADIDRAVRAARECFDNSSWPELSFAERGSYLRKMASALETHVDMLARVTTDESGLPYHTVAPVHVHRSAELLRYYADLSERIRIEEPKGGSLAAATLRREPVGVVGSITPWNAPIVIAHFTIGPAVLAGCPLILKTAPETPLHGQLLAQIYGDILPPGAFNVVPASREASEALVRHSGVDKISFTGSSATGRHIASICGEQLTRCSLELGGKSAGIVLEDADLSAVMPVLGIAIVQNNCQACVGQTRILAPQSRYDEVVEAVAAYFDGLKVGDPYDADTNIGPLIAERQLRRAEDYVRIGLDEGAKIVRGGNRPKDLDCGWYLDLTLFRDVDNGMRIAREEIFGPVFVVIPYADDRDAIRIANDSDYGLSGTVWTSDQERGWNIARKIRTGNFGVNTFAIEYSAPFGGFKSSGIGRQLGEEGLAGFFELKSITSPLGA